MSSKEPEFKGLEGVYKLVARLRAPNGCPWDRKQTNESLKYNLIEESYELLDAIERKDDRAIAEELGDILFLVLMHIRIAEEEGRFTLDDVTDGIIQKMIRRHPHVFGEVRVESHDEILQNWEKIKRKERKSIFEGISFGMPALLLAQNVGEKARRVGFDWPSPEGIIDKIREELDEFLEAKAHGDREKIEEEFGDVLFSLVNLARHLGIDAEGALRKTVRKFVERFQQIEAEARRRGVDIEKMSLQEMDAIWESAKSNPSSTKS